jgi:HTH-type transcriptional regulator/antitoxin HigA
MIYSDKQYSVSTAELTKLRDALSAAGSRQSDRPWLKQAEIDALKSQIADIESELAEYDLLNQGRYRFQKRTHLKSCRVCWCRHASPLV